MNNIDRQYKELLEHILVFGNNKSDRTGTGTRSVFGWKIVHRMEEGFPLLTTKKMYSKGIITELLWFLRGDTNIKYLVDNDCHIWDGDAYKNYDANYSDWKDGFIGIDLDDSRNNEIRKFTKEEFINKIKTDNEFANKWGELGPIYGKQWRSWAKFSEKVYTREIREIPEGGRFAETRNVNWVGGSEVVYIDQIANLISELRTNPDSRRLMVNAWNVGELDQMVLPPCHYGFQVYTRELSSVERMEYYSKYYMKEDESMSVDDLLKVDYEKLNIPTRAISLMWNQRSVDVPLGLPFNIASYGLLLEIIAKAVNMVPEELIGNLGDCHIYNNQIDGVKEQITRKPYKLPTLKHMKTDEFYRTLSEDLSLITHLDNTDFVIENYQSHPTIKMPLSN
jgi:thymidylate synthase